MPFANDFYDHTSLAGRSGRCLFLQHGYYDPAGIPPLSKRGGVFIIPDFPEKTIENSWEKRDNKEQFLLLILRRAAAGAGDDLNRRIREL